MSEWPDWCDAGELISRVLDLQERVAKLEERADPAENSLYFTPEHARELGRASRRNRRLLADVCMIPDCGCTGEAHP